MRARPSTISKSLVLAQRRRLYLLIFLILPILWACSASQTQIFQSQLFAWDDQNIITARGYADQIRKHWLYNYKVIEEFVGAYDFQGEKYRTMRLPMDKIKALVSKDSLTEEDVAVINVNFGKFLQRGGEHIIKEGLPQLIKLVADFKVFFGI